MKTYQLVFLLIVFSQSTIFSQQIDIAKFTLDCKSPKSNETTLSSVNWEYSSETKIFTYCANGVLKNNKVKLPDDKFWNLTEFDNQFYFVRSEFAKDVYDYYCMPYDYLTNQTSAPVKVLSTASKSDPTWFSEKQFNSTNNKFKAIRINPGNKSSGSAAASYAATYSSSSTVISVIDSKLKVLYTKELAFEFDDKDFKYDVSNLLGDDGTWYWFGIKYSGKGDTKSGQYGCYITNPEGNTTSFIPIDFDKGYINDVNNVIIDDKLIQYGTWSIDDQSNTLSGSFYMELDLKTLKVLNLQTSTLSGEDLAKFVFTPALKNKVEKKMFINGIDYVFLNSTKQQFDDGRYFAVYRRKVNTSIEDPTYEVGSYIVMMFGPKAEDMTHTIISVNQRSAGRLVPFDCGSGFANNTLVLFFNDLESNAGITNGEARLFEPLPTQYKSTATFAVMINQDGSVKRQQIASYRDDNRVYFSTGGQVSDDSFIIYMLENPPMKMLDNSFEAYEFSTFIITLNR